jgi:PAS domain S-box-containing protein
MNISLRKRISYSFIVSIMIILLQGIMVFYFLDGMDEQMRDITARFNQENNLMDEVRGSLNSLFKEQRNLMSRGKKESIESSAEILELQLNKVDRLYEENPEVRKSIATMLTILKQYRDLLVRLDEKGIRPDAVTVATISDNIEEAFEDFSKKQFSLSEEKENRINHVIAGIKRNMMITLIITFLGTFLLMLVIPGKISLPFKKLNDAIRELQECNFDVSIYYNQKDEIGELAREINKMITSIKQFEELRIDRISVELRKFDALANMVKKNVLVANAQGQLVYVNHSLYSLIQLSSEDIIGKNIENTLIPESIKEAYLLALKRRTKVENAAVTIESRNDDGEVSEQFHGFANIVPIRGKESSLDYYLMVLSKEVFA